MHPRRSIPEGMTFHDWHAPDGWPLRAFDWPAESPRGSLLFLGGRGDFVEKYLEALAHWHAQGWRLSGFDWRGQGGSGRLLADPLICHQASFEPLLADLAAYVSEWTARTPGPHVIVAHSMGANLALRLLAERPAGIDAAVLSSPMLGIRVRGIGDPILRMVARGAALLGLGERRLWEGDAGDVGGRMTSCPERQADKHWWKVSKPEIASGAPSWGWAAAACASIARARAAPLETVATPILMLVSERDPIVDVRSIRRAAARLPDAELETFPGTGHELLREADAIRAKVYARIDAFLDRP